MRCRSGGVPLGEAVEERVETLPRCGGIGELGAAEPVDPVSLQPQVAVCRHHRRVPAGAGLAGAICVVLLAVAFDDDPDAIGQEQEEVHALPGKRR